MTTTGATPAQCFISYHRPDNKTYDGVVDRLASEIGGRFGAETGRDLSIFLDRDSIPGGGDWRERIAAAIASATIFIPVVTMRYFQSEACREELIAFYDGATHLGVTDLIIPVILAGRTNIRSDDPRPEVRLIERLNYRSIEDAVDAGYQSPQWKSAVRTLVTDVARGLATAEDAIAKDEAGGDDASPALLTVTASNADEVAADAPVALKQGAADDDLDLLDLGPAFESLTEHANTISILMTELGDVVREHSGDVDRITQGTAAEQRAFLLRLAAALTPVSARLGAEGAELEAGVRRVDQKLRALVSELSAIQGPMAEQFRKQLTSPLAGMETGETLGQMDSMVQTLSAFAVLSVSLRKALQPAVRGVRSTRNAVSIANSWRTLAGA